MSGREEERDIGMEILEGIRQIKRGEVGRVTHFPPIGCERGANLPEDTRRADIWIDGEIGRIFRRRGGVQHRSKL